MNEVEAEREACAAIADEWADDLLERQAEGLCSDPITVEQVVNGYRMIAKLIRRRATKS